MTGIQELRQEPHLSASAVNDYIECGLAYRFGRVDQVQSEYTADALLFGKCIHKALEAFYLARMEGSEFSCNDLLQEFTEQWHKAYTETTDLKFKKGDNFDTILNLGINSLISYWNELPEVGVQVLAIEEPFSFKIEGLSVPVVGVIDLVEEDENGNIIITDFKTSSRAYSKDEIDKNFQLTVYHMAAKKNGYADRDILLRFDCLIKTRKPKFEQYWTVRTEEDERRAEKKLIHVWEGIEKGVFVPNDTSWKCGYCSFKSHCDSWFQGKEDA